MDGKVWAMGLDWDMGDRSLGCEKCFSHGFSDDYALYPWIDGVF